jgi:hypothetical protein
MCKIPLKKMNWLVKIITFGWASAITLSPFGIYFSEKAWKYQYSSPISWNRIVNHESIHWRQQMEMLILFFYIWYFIEWLIKLIIRIPFYIFAPNSNILKESAYSALSFEREAYTNDDDLEYLKNRRKYSWIKRVFKSV